MLVAFLKFGPNKEKAGEHMEGHKGWIAKGFADGVFLLVGSLTPEGGGAVIAHGLDRHAFEARLAEDPFVRESVVTVEISEISPARTDERLEFLAA